MSEQPPVHRDEFDALRNLATETAASVNQLVSITKSQSQQIGELSTDVKAILGARGVGGGTLIAGLSAIAAWSIVLGALGMQHVEGRVAPVSTNLGRIERHLERHEEKVPELSSKIAVLEERLKHK